MQNSTHKQRLLALNCLVLCLAITGVLAQKSVFPVASFHGFIRVGPSSADIFYWGFPSKSKPETDPIIFWFNGGPGVSSVLGLLEENGPMLLDQESGAVQPNSLGWNQNATIIYIDHPVGVGLSHADIRDIPQTEQQNAPLMLEFFTQLLAVRPELASLDMYLFGESYAGHFVPFIAQILQQSQQPMFRIKGVGLGNTLMSAQHQYPEYSTFAYAPENRNYTQTTEAAFESTRKQFEVCAATLRFSPSRVKDGLLRDFCQSIYFQLVLDADGNEKFDVFNVRNPPQLSKKSPMVKLSEIDIEGYMNDPVVLSELQSDKLFAEQTDGYFDVMTRRDWATDVLPVLGYLLEHEVKVLAYHGSLDFICNWMGGLAALNNIPWSQKAEFIASPSENYHDYGTMKQHGLLQFLIINDAGHMVPQDQPANSLDMLTRFIFGLQ